MSASRPTCLCCTKLAACDEKGGGRKKRQARPAFDQSIIRAANEADIDGRADDVAQARLRLGLCRAAHARALFRVARPFGTAEMRRQKLTNRGCLICGGGGSIRRRCCLLACLLAAERWNDYVSLAKWKATAVDHDEPGRRRPFLPSLCGFSCLIGISRAIGEHKCGRVVCIINEWKVDSTHAGTANCLSGSAATVCKPLAPLNSHTWHPRDSLASEQSNLGWHSIHRILLPRPLMSQNRQC